MIKVTMHEDGTAYVNVGSSSSFWPKELLFKSAIKARECCNSRKVYYPIGSEHCPCLACEVDKQHRKWRKQQGLNHVIKYTEPISGWYNREPNPGDL